MRRRGTGPFALLALLVGAVLVVVLPGALGYGVIDDAYISLRYAQNFAAGEGLVFNPGEAVEGYTNFLWTALLGAGIAAGAEGPGFALWAGIVAGVLGLGVALLLHARVAAGEGSSGRGLTCGWRLASTPLALAVAPTYLAYAASGLESAAFAFLLTLHALLLLGRLTGAGGPRALALAGLVLALANLTRPEATALFVFDLVALGLLLVLGRSRAEGPYVTPKAIACFAAAFLLPFGAFLLWRHATYGYWLPNTYYAKVGGPSSALLGSGGSYAFAVALRTLAVLAVPLGLFAARARRDLRLLYLSALTLVLLLVIALVGGDHMALWRFGVPVLPFAVILVREGVESLTKERIAAPLVALGVLLAFGGAGFWTARSVQSHDMTEHARAQLEVELAEDWGAFGRWLARYADEGDAIALLPIGAVGFYSQLRVIDQVGLIDEHIAHLDVETGEGYQGHEKFDNEYVLAQRPRFVMALHLVTLDQPVTQAQYDGSPFFSVHEDLLRQPALRRDYTFQCIRGGDGMYFSFYERTDALRR